MSIRGIRVSVDPVQLLNILVHISLPLFKETCVALWGTVDLGRPAGRWDKATPFIQNWAHLATIVLNPRYRTTQQSQ